MVSRARALLACLALAAGARADASGCLVEPAFEPARAVVGQQVLYRARVLRRDDVQRVEWVEPPAFTSARAETLPPAPQPDARREGVLYHVYDELRAFFPERSGRFEQGGAVLRCESPGGAETVRVAPAALEVLPLPEAGRPDGYAGLVGPLILHLSVTPERIALGESVRVALMARGGGNLWLLDAPFPEAAFAGAEVFSHAPELAFERGRGLFVRQHLALDVVPRAPGRLVVPELRIPYFDPDGGVYRVATTRSVEVGVEERAVAYARPKRRGPAERASGSAQARGGLLFALAGVVALGAIAGAAVVRRRRRGGDDEAAQALAAARRAHAAGDSTGELAALSRALRAALARKLPGASALSVEELALRAQPQALGAAALLAQLERARFQPGATAPGADQVERAVRALGAARGGRAGTSAALLLLATVASAAGCASEPVGRDVPMTPARLEAALREHAHDFEVVAEQLRFVYDGVRMVSLYDVRADRMRLVAAVAEESALTVASARILLQANFGNTLDARYAIRDGMLYAVYLHPLSNLQPRELESALEQVALLVRNYGKTYSAGEFVRESP